MKLLLTKQLSSKPFISLLILLGTGLFLVLLVSACGVRQPGQPTATPTLTLTATFPPTLTPTPMPLGSSENPFVIGLVSENGDPQMSAAADELARQVGRLAGVTVRGTIYSSYQNLLDELSFGNVHIAWMPPLSYLFASQRGLAEVILLTNHFGVYQYGTQFMANVENNFTPHFDPVSGLNASDAPTALAQFQGLRPCWVEPLSVSGYVLPAGLLELHGITSEPAVLTQTHPAVVRALYIKGICDYGAAFSISGDPRTASAVQDDLPDVMNRILIIWRSDAVIPNLNLSLITGLSEGNRLNLTNAFLELGSTPEGKGLLSLSAGNYQIEEVKTVKDDIYNPLRDVVEALDLDLRNFIGK